MNRTFKVAKSLTRGVVVTSEKASSYQGKAVKTVIACKSSKDHSKPRNEVDTSLKSPV